MEMALGKQLFQPTHVCPKRLLFKLENREDFIPKPNGLASKEVFVKEDSIKGILRTKKTNLKTIHPSLRIFFKSKGNEFDPNSIV